MLKKAAPLCVMAAALGVTACGAEGGLEPDATSAVGDEPGSSDDSDGTHVPPNPNAPFGAVVATYFAEWSVYGRDFHVADIAADKLTHVLYGFIPVCGPNDALKAANPSGYDLLQKQCADKPDYSVTIHDTYAALEQSYPGDKWDDPVRGNFGQLMKMKAANPGVKVLPSVGGWTLSDPFFSMAGNDANRKVFVDSVITFLQKYELFDGVDIDWEFPGGGGASVGLGSSDDGQAYVVLMKDLREALDGLSKETGRDYELTSAIGAAPKMVDAVDYESAAPYMDYIFAMTYDYYGAWGSDLGHLTALHESDNNDLNAGYNVAASIENLIEAGVPASKLVLGVAMYGRGWKGVTGVSGNSPFTGEGGGPIKGSWEAGIIDYKDIASQYAGAKSEGLAGFTYSYDETAEAPYLYNATTGELISYDNPRSVKAKRAYAAKMGLAGLFSWEIDGDNGAILEAMSGI